MAQKRNSDNSPSLDRIDSKKGYIKNNIKMISNKANIMKLNGTANEHIQIAMYIRDNSPPEDYSI
jgi:hypothetical protein